MAVEWDRTETSVHIGRHMVHRHTYQQNTREHTIKINKYFKKRERT